VACLTHGEEGGEVGYIETMSPAHSALLRTPGSPPPAPPEIRWVSVSELAVLVGDDDQGPERLERWLTSRELEIYRGFTVPKRRREWLAGRIAAKEVIGRRHGLVGDDRFRAIEIVSRRAGPERGRPVYRVGGELGRFDLSISHSGDIGAVALAPEPGQRVGIDVERVEPRPPGFEPLALGAVERERLEGLEADPRWRMITQMWALKEALTKAVGTGLRIAPPRIEVVLDPTCGALADPPFALHGDSDPEVARAVRALAGRRMWAEASITGETCLAWVLLAPVTKVN
jgi:phosphopantetheinyl transferase